MVRFSKSNVPLKLLKREEKIIELIEKEESKKRPNPIVIKSLEKQLNGINGAIKNRLNGGIIINE